MTLGSLFDGIGGFPFVAQMYGIEPIWASEIESAPISITKRNFPNMKHLGDVTKINGGLIPPVDIITFGSPCQDMSVAGKRAGLDGERSGLFMEAIRIIKEMRTATNGEFPKFGIWENVPGAFSSNNGEDFRTVIQEFTSITGSRTFIPEPPNGKWGGAGLVMGDTYSFAWRTLDAQYMGVPQRRRRIYAIIAFNDFTGQRAAEILFNEESQRRYFTQSIAPWKRFTGITKESTQRVDSSPTFCIQGNVVDHGDKAKCHGKGYTEDISYTLTTVDKHVVAFGRQSKPSIIEDSTSPTIVSQGPNMIALSMTTGEYTQVCNEKSPTLQARDYKDPNLVIKVPEEDAQGFDGYNGRLTEDKSGKLWNGSDIVGTLTASNAGGNQRMPEMGNFNGIIENKQNKYTVRRLTPVECERLQGYPDDYTKYGVNDAVISDCARYKALGNSVALPCVNFVILGILNSVYPMNDSPKVIVKPRIKKHLF